MGIHSAALLDRKFLEMLKLLNIYLNHFPRHEKYALCTRIRNTAYGLYDLITEGQKRYHKKTTLTQMDIAHEQLRMQIRLAHELGYFAFKDGKQSDKTPGAQAAHRLSCLEDGERGSLTTIAIGAHQSLVIDARVQRPVFCGHGASVQGKGDIPAIVAELFSAKRPAAIIRRIISIVVNTIQRVFRRWRIPHVSHERGKGSPPFSAHLNPSASIVMVAGVVRVFAALHHASPAMVKRVIAKRVCGFQGFPKGRAVFFAQAPA